MSVVYRGSPEHSHIAEIVPHLYICGFSDLNRTSIQQRNITLIINATNEIMIPGSLGNVAHIKLWVDDTARTDLSQHFEPVSDRIDEEISRGGAVLVHCFAGVSRSAAICLAYLTKYHCSTLREAYRIMHSKRKAVAPNIGFWRQLIEYEKRIKKKPPSVKIITDPLSQTDLIPDVYLDPEIRSQRPAAHQTATKELLIVLILGVAIGQ